MAIFQREKQTVPTKEILAALARGDEIDLSHCKIEEPVDINRYFDEPFSTLKEQLNLQQEDTTITITFNQKITFNSCTFEDDVVFAPPWSQIGTIKVIFNSDVYFNSSKIIGQARFTGCQFNSHAGFDGCAFKSVACFRHVCFCQASMMRTAEFEGYGLFSNTTFKGHAKFSSTFFRKGVNLTNVKFLSYTDFAGVYAGSKTVPVYDGIFFAKKCYGDDETFWRFIKQCAQESGHYQMAGENFYQERCAHFWLKLRGTDYEHLSIFKKSLRQIYGLRLLPEFAFGRILFGYGERPIRALLSSAMVILFCAVIYSNNGSQIIFRGEPAGTEKFIDYLYFSVTTFATLGLGDVYPTDNSFIRFVVMSEVLAGAVLMSLFVVSLAKRFSRS